MYCTLFPSVLAIPNSFPKTLPLLLSCHSFTLYYFLPKFSNFFHVKPSLLFQFLLALIYFALQFILTLMFNSNFFLFGFTYQKLKHDTFDFHTPKHLILYHTELIQHFNRITMSLKTVKLFSHQGEIIYVPLGIHAIIIFLAI